MIKKIVTLAVGFVFAFVAIFFSVRAEGVADGKGSGKDTAVADPKEFGAILTELPDSDYYEALLMEEQMKKAESGTKSLAADADGDLEDLLPSVTPVTLYEKSTLSTRNSYSTNTYETSTKSYLRRTMYVYYGKDAVYYDSVGTVTALETYRRGDSTTEGSTRTTTTTTLDFDAHLYLGKSGAYIKFNKWEETTEVLNEEYKNHAWTEVKDEDKEDDYSVAAREEIAKSLKKNYGKWISLMSNGPTLDDMENGGMPDGFDPTMDPSNMSPAQMQQYMSQMYEYMAQVVCYTAAEQYYEQFLSANTSNSDIFATYANLLKSYDAKEAFEKSGNIYKITELGRQSLPAMFGWSGTSTPSTSGCNFVIDMSDSKAPALFASVDYNSYQSSGLGNSGSTDKDYTLRDEIGVKHINNTEVPQTPDTKNDMYTLYGDAVKSIISSMMSKSSSTLLVNDLNGALEVIG